ncbi:MAG: hypothetical protein Q9222_000182 [Ikaeria aurantiellina]
MSPLPATPSKPNVEANNPAAPTIKQPISASRATRPSINEPSPASTYGETAAGDSIPATPQDAPSYGDPSLALLETLRTSSLNDSVDRASTSPFHSHGLKILVHSEQHPTVGRDFASQSGASPSIERSFNTFDASPINEDRYEQMKKSPTWHHENKFIRRNECTEQEDPFITSQPLAKHASDMGSEAGFRPREDRAHLPLSADTAQAMLPPNACVFVANLTQAKSDDQLEHSVSTVFQAFGNVYVKIRRDNKGMPFAFCQYENVNDAQRAITMGRGLLIDGRACRTEVAKVNRSLYLSKVTGGAIAEHEAREVLGRFGAIEKLWYCSQTDKEMFRLPDGVWVMFAFFQDCRDAQAGFRDDPTYRLEQPKMPEDMRARLGGRPGAAIGPQPHRFSPARPGNSPQAMMRRAADMCSVFVGNLPPDATEDKLRELFGMYGRILQIEIVRKPSVNAGVNTFAFVQFRSVEEAENAACLLYQIEGHRLRVERKESAETLAHREAMFSGGSPRNRFPINPQDTMAMLFQHGVSVGMANATASHSPPSAPSMYTPFNSYQPFGMPAFTSPVATSSRLIEDEGSAGMHGHAHNCVPQSLQQGMTPTLGQYPLPTISPAQTAQYLPYNGWTQRTTNYQWPPASSANQTSTLRSAMVKDQMP